MTKPPQSSSLYHSTDGLLACSSIQVLIGNGSGIIDGEQLPETLPVPLVQSIQQSLPSCPEFAVVQQDTDDKSLEELKLQTSWYLIAPKDYCANGMECYVRLVASAFDVRLCVQGRIPGGHILSIHLTLSF